jgi:SOUL heme-binding protein
LRTARRLLLRIERKLQPDKVVAAGQFGGLPLDWEVTEAERKLRAALLLDGLRPKDGYQLARYNDPFTPPFVRRNEVIIELEAFELD